MQLSDKEQDIINFIRTQEDGCEAFMTIHLVPMTDGHILQINKATPVSTLGIRDKLFELLTDMKKWLGCNQSILTINYDCGTIQVFQNQRLESNGRVPPLP